MCLIGSGCIFKRTEYTKAFSKSKKRLDNTCSGQSPPVVFHRGVLCAEQLKLVKPESVSSSIVIETPRRHYPSVRYRSHNQPDLSGSCKRVSILKETSSTCAGEKTSPVSKRVSTTQHEQRVSITTKGVTYKTTDSDHSFGHGSQTILQDDAATVVTVEPEKRKVSPADSGMYSASSAKSVDWETRDASLTSIDPAIAAQDSAGSASASQIVTEEEEEVSTEGTLEGGDEENSSDGVELIRVASKDDK